MNFRAIGGLAGAAIGFAVVKAAFLDTFEAIAFEVAWHAARNGHFFSGDSLLNSSTFWKCVAGAVVGLVAGVAIGGQLQKRG
jgi:hypothetical protein